jgi:hypothetical protein
MLWLLASTSISLPHSSILLTDVLQYQLILIRGWGLRKTWTGLAKKPEENRPLETRRHGWEDNIKTDVKQGRRAR